MSDMVIGIAILDQTLNPQRMAVLCKPEGLGTRVEVITVYEKGTEKPITRNGAAWEYEIRGDRLFITPSLHVQSDRGRGWQTDFHNAYAWDVQFQLAGPSENDPDWPTKHMWYQIREANPSEYPRPRVTP